MSEKIEKALNCKVDLDGEKLTVREYFKKLMLILWEEGESFSGKRPFGDSGWECDIYNALAVEGVIEADIEDDNGEIYVENIDKAKADMLIYRAINHVFK